MWVDSAQLRRLQRSASSRGAPRVQLLAPSLLQAGEVGNVSVSTSGLGIDQPQCVGAADSERGLVWPEPPWDYPVPHAEGRCGKQVKSMAGIAGGGAEAAWLRLREEGLRLQLSRPGLPAPPSAASNQWLPLVPTAERLWSTLSQSQRRLRLRKRCHCPKTQLAGARETDSEPTPGILCQVGGNWWDQLRAQIVSCNPDASSQGQAGPAGSRAAAVL